jgi:hypothetical protein
MTGVRPLLGAALSAAALSEGQLAFAQHPVVPPPDTPVIDGHNLRVTSGASVVVLDLGCEGRTSLRSQDELFVACGADGVVEVDLSNPLAPRRVGRMHVDGDATDLFLRDGRVWVEVAHIDARPVITRSGPTPEVSTAGSLPAVPPPAAEHAAPPEPEATRPSLMAPPRRGGLWELSAMAGAYLNFGPVAGGATGWASVVYRFDLPIVVRAELSPFGIGIGSSQTVNISAQGTNPSRIFSVAAAHLLVGLDTQFIEVALGAGGATLGNQSFGSNGSPATGGPSIVEEARFGARDGLALNVESVTVGANSQFQFGSFVASVQIPLTQQVMLTARGGGGNVGLLFGDLGARLVVQGDGGPGTVALTGFFGGAGIDFQSCSSPLIENGGGCVSTSLGGPSLGGGVEWRP